MSNDDLDFLIHKQLTEQLSDEEQARLDAVLKSPDSGSIVSDIAKIWETSANYSPSVGFDSNVGFNSLMEKIAAETEVITEAKPVADLKSEAKVFRLFSLSTMRRVAAVFVFAVAGYLAYNNAGQDSYSSGTETSYAMLDDGTSVWLAPNSKLDYKSSDKNGREVVLKGKAYFDVARDESRPFSIHSDEITITVLGTSFTVDGFTGEVSVNTGKVAVASDTDAVTLVRGDKVNIDDSKFSLGSTTRSDFDWINPVLRFDNTPLDQVIKELSLYFDTDISYKGRTDLSKCRFTSTDLSDTNLEQIISILKATYSMDVEESEDGKKISLSKVRCK